MIEKTAKYKFVCDCCRNQSGIQNTEELPGGWYKINEFDVDYATGGEWKFYFHIKDYRFDLLVFCSLDCITKHIQEKLSP